MKQDAVQLLDGALGTELERRGYRTELPLWSASAIQKAPDLVRQIHEEYLHSGADLITANTFRVSFYTYEKSGLNKYQVIRDLENALRLAFRANQSAWTEKPVLASLTSLEDCYRPDLTPVKAILEDYHGRQIEVIRQAGYQKIIVETMHTRQEAEIIARLCHEQKMPFLMSFITGKADQLLSGESLSETIQSIIPYQPEAILLNCRPGNELNLQIPFLKSFPGPIGVYPNGSGEPDNEYGWRFNEPHPENAFLQNAMAYLEKGVHMIGGCCGTRPRDIETLKNFLEKGTS